MTKEVFSKWDYPEKEGFYWVIDSSIDGWIIARYVNNIFFASGTDELEITGPNDFRSRLYQIKKYRYIPKPK